MFPNNLEARTTNLPVLVTRGTRGWLRPFFPTTEFGSIEEKIRLLSSRRRYPGWRAEPQIYGVGARDRRGR
jgi:hypothetical protein